MRMAGLLLVGFIGQLPGQPRLPDGRFDVAYRLRANGSLQTGAYHMVLGCLRGSCQLTTLVVPGCFGGSGMPAFSQSSTEDGSLRVHAEGSSVLIVDERVGVSQTRFRLSYRGADVIGLAGTNEDAGSTSAPKYEVVPFVGFTRVQCEVDLLGTRK